MMMPYIRKGSIKAACLSFKNQSGSPEQLKPIYLSSLKVLPQVYRITEERTESNCTGEC